MNALLRPFKPACALLAVFLSGAHYSSAADAFTEARTQLIEGCLSDAETGVEVEIKAASMEPGARCVYSTQAENGQFQQSIKLFPGQNLVTAKTATGSQERVLPFSTGKPTLRVEFNCLNKYYHLDVNDWSESGHDVLGTYYRREAEAGLYRISVNHFVEAKELVGYDGDGFPIYADVPPVAALTTVSVYVNDELVSRTSNADGKLRWSVGTVVLHSGDQVGGFSVDGTRLDMAGQGELKGFSPQSGGYYEVTALAGPNGASPVYMTVGNAAQFSASGTLFQYDYGEDQGINIIESFSSSDETVGSIDALGVFVAKAPGHTQISCEGYAGDPIDVYVVQIDINGDTNRDGDVNDDDESGEDANTLTRGILITPPLRALAASGNDITGLATIKINAQPVGPVPGLSLKLKKTYETNGCTLHFLSMNGVKMPDISEGQSYDLNPWPADILTLAVMPQYARPRTTENWPIRFDLELQAVDANGTVLYSDTIRLTVAPMLLPPEYNAAQKIYTRAAELSGLPGVTYIANNTIYPWAQDMVKFVKYQTVSGQPKDMFIDLDHEGKGNFPDKLRDDEHWDGGMIWGALGTGTVSMRGEGGNIMATPSLPNAPFGRLLIGSNPIRDVQPLDPWPYWQGQGVQFPVRIDTDWLLVGHLDEILMWVAPDKVLYADPWNAADLLHQEIAAGNQTNSLWFGFDAAGQNKSIQQVVVAPSGAGFKLTTLPAPGLSDSPSPVTIAFTNAVFVEDDILRVDDEILKVTSANGTTVTVARAQAGRPATAHAIGNVIYAYTDAIKANLPVDPAVLSIVERMATATNQLRLALGDYSATFEPMPVLFKCYETQNGTRSTAESANVVNCLLGMNGTIFYSKTGCTVFRDYISSKLPSAQEVSGVWESLHCNNGEIHCSTAVQRELNLTPPWWQQVNNWE